MNAALEAQLRQFGRMDREVAEAIRQEECRLCAEFWVWLEAERKRRGVEPSDEEKSLHTAPIRAFRARVEAVR